MIAPETQFVGPLRVPLSRIVVTEYQPRYARRVLHYLRLLLDPRHARHDTGIVMLAPFVVETERGPIVLLTLLDGHHRFVANLLAGRSDVLALIHVAPEAADAFRAAFPDGIVSEWRVAQREGVAA